jgi:hypothetical protein
VLYKRGYAVLEKKLKVMEGLLRKELRKSKVLKKKYESLKHQQPWIKYTTPIHQRKDLDKLGHFLQH